MDFSATSAFLTACSSGDLRTVEGLYSISPGEERLGFWFACENGHLETAQWLYRQAGIHLSDPDFFTGDTKDLFDVVCEEGFLELAVWLYSTGEVTVGSVYLAFENACKQGQLSIVKWLCKTVLIDPSVTLLCGGRYWASLYRHWDIMEWLEVWLDQKKRWTGLRAAWITACVV